MSANQMMLAEECIASIESQTQTKIRGSFSVTYTLIHLTSPKSLYILTAECGDEYEGICIGRDKARALKILSLVCKYGVFPHVLDETVREIEV